MDMIEQNARDSMGRHNLDTVRVRLEGGHLPAHKVFRDLRDHGPRREPDEEEQDFVRKPGNSKRLSAHQSSVSDRDHLGALISRPLKILVSDIPVLAANPVRGSRAERRHRDPGALQFLGPGFGETQHKGIARGV